MSLTFIFDVIAFVGLLTGFCSMLWFNKKLASMHKSRDHFQNLLDTFSNALDRGQKSLSQLQETNTSIMQELDLKMASASVQIDDLSFFIDRGERVVERLDNNVRVARALKEHLDHTIDRQEQGRQEFSVHEAMQELPQAYRKASAMTNTLPEPDPEEFVARLREERLFKTEARLDHPWGTLQRPKSAIVSGKRYS